MTRAEYTARRLANRCGMQRELMGLPHHPDGSGLAPCQRCDGNGCVDITHWNPQSESTLRCMSCLGTGMVPDGHRDPLLRLRQARQRRIRLRDPGAYQHLRRLCATPVWQLRLIEAAVGCELATRHAVEAWREVA